MKKRMIVLLLLVFVVISQPVTGAEKKVKQPKFGLGICVGEPVGMNFKFWLTKKYAFDMVLGWQGKEKIYFHIDYLVHNYEFVSKGDLAGDVPFYYGIGVRGDRILRGKGKFSSGIRVILGVNYLFEEMPVDIFAELVPTFIIEPEATGLLAAGMGVRYYFE